jgi:hypothetical protein
MSHGRMLVQRPARTSQKRPAPPLHVPCTPVVTAPRIRGAQLPALQQAGARAGRGQPGRPTMTDKSNSQ